MIAPFIEQVCKIEVEKARPPEASVRELLDDADGRIRIPRKRNLDRVPDRREKRRKRHSQLPGQAGQRIAVQHSHRTVDRDERDQSSVLQDERAVVLHGFETYPIHERPAACPAEEIGEILARGAQHSNSINGPGCRRALTVASLRYSRE